MAKVMLIKHGEKGFGPVPDDISEEEAQRIVVGFIKAMRLQIQAVPIYQQYEFSQRAENILKRERITTWGDLLAIVRSIRCHSCEPPRGAGSHVLAEWSKALEAEGLMAA